MKPKLVLGGVTAVLMMLLAGCTGTGNFDVQQTEPFRVRLEGEPQTVVVREGAEPQQVEINPCESTCDDTDDHEVDVKVQIKQTSSDACRVRITIKEVSTGRILETRDVDTGSSSGQTSSSPSSNSTTTVTQTTTVTPSSGDVVIQNFNVNVKGKENIVVLTQAIEGDASVDVSAVRASGNAQVGQDDEPSSSTTATTSASGNSTSGP